MDDVTLFQLRDFQSEDDLGLVRVTNVQECTEKNVDVEDEIFKSWDEFNRIDELGFDPMDVETFIGWHNENNVSQLKRIYVDIVQPSEW